MTKTLRIAMLAIHSSPLGRLGTADTGGMSVYALELAVELGSRGHQVDIFTRQTSPGREEVIEYAANVRIICLAVQGTESLLREALYTHLHTFYRSIEFFARRDGDNYDIIHSNYWLSGMVGDLLKAAWHCPHVITFHTVAALKMAALPGHTENPQRRAEEKRLLRCCDGVIVATEREGQDLAVLGGRETAATFTIPCGVDLERFTTDSDVVQHSTISELNAQPLLLFVGRFDPMKGVETVLQSLYHLKTEPEVHLALIGGDGRRSMSFTRIERLASELGIANRVHMLGPVTHARMVLYYQRADVVVVPSRYESFGLVILEALATGTPVASTPVGIAPYIIEPGVNGYLAGAGDERSLTQAISSTLKIAQCQESEKIRETVSDWSWSRVVTLLLDAYYTLLCER